MKQLAQLLAGNAVCRSHSSPQISCRADSLPCTQLVCENWSLKLKGPVWTLSCNEQHANQWHNIKFSPLTLTGGPNQGVCRTGYDNVPTDGSHGRLPRKRVADDLGEEDGRQRGRAPLCGLGSGDRCRGRQPRHVPPTGAGQCAPQGQCAGRAAVYFSAVARHTVETPQLECQYI